ncbi:hypothetical protein DM02DRAFT_74541 [Periconia macrospinosa]|uniref:Mediator of RNA polymerase II transcription subunit 9 n=1 Tax=Periconia macrospinosa TaxID=97972 RepID=A0A2V1DHR2_9PLEO|nr:hypothetical protein DM02DRAFT_74541 [Periconia macrospinosa]
MSAAPTPHASISAAASFPATGSATPALPPQPSTPDLPPPSTFDVLPDLHKILSRLLQTPPQAPPSAGGAATAPTPTPAADGPLEIEQVASATAEVKLKLQRAQKAILSLPGIERTCEDQQDEIAYLETRIETLRAALTRLGQPASPSAAAEQQDGGGGGGSGDQSHTGPVDNSHSIIDELYKMLGE